MAEDISCTIFIEDAEGRHQLDEEIRVTLPPHTRVLTILVCLDGSPEELSSPIFRWLFRSQGSVRCLTATRVQCCRQSLPSKSTSVYVA